MHTAETLCMQTNSSVETIIPFIQSWEERKGLGTLILPITRLAIGINNGLAAPLAVYCDLPSMTFNSSSSGDSGSSNIT